MDTYGGGIYGAGAYGGAISGALPDTVQPTDAVLTDRGADVTMGRTTDVTFDYAADLLLVP
jgi:hypothetical protein